MTKPAINPNIMHENTSYDTLLKWLPALSINTNYPNAIDETIQINGINKIVEKISCFFNCPYT